MIFKKTYTGLVKRVLSEGFVYPSEVPTFYTELETKTEIEEQHNNIFISSAEIATVKKNTVDIVSNTLAINITDIVVDGIPYYNEIIAHEDEDLYDIAKKVEGKWYTNISDNYIRRDLKLFTIRPVYPLEVGLLNNRTSIRKLKDSFKITIKTNTPETVQVKLIATNQLTYTLQNNLLSYYENFLKYNKKVIPLFITSFNFYKKEEVHPINNIRLKDKPIGEIYLQRIDEDYVKVVYDSYLNNLNIKTLPHVLSNVYLKLSTKIAELTTKEGDIKLLTIHPENKYLTKLETNPYINHPQYGAKHLGILFSWGISDTDYLNVPLGSRIAELDMHQFSSNTLDSFNKKDKTIVDKIDRQPITYNKIKQPLTEKQQQLLKIIGDSHVG